MVRDLDKLRTRSEFRLRAGHIVLIIAGTAVGVGLIFAVGSAMAGTSPDESRRAPAADPFAGLEQTAPATTVAAKAALVVVAVPPPESLAPLELTFHERLAGPPPGAAPLPAEPPFVAAPRADPVEAPLPAESPAAPAPIVAPPRPPAPPTPVVAPVPPPVVARAPAVVQLPPNVPLAPAPVQSVREPMAQPLPPGNPEPQYVEEATPPLAQAGERGIFTLQVSSFDTQDAAVAFMNMLRQRGHESFLVRADCGEHGIIYRVRVGPFASQADAERYRRKFERTERIPTFVVRRTLPTSG